MFVGSDRRRTGQIESDESDIHRVRALDQVFVTGPTQMTEIVSDQFCCNQRGDTRQQVQNALGALLVKSDSGGDESDG